MHINQPLLERPVNARAANPRGATLRAAMAGLLLFAANLPAANAQADPFIGQMMLVPYNFCPSRWAEANGQIMPIAQNTALFSLLGTTYGGNGQTTFALPDLRGRVPVGQGQGPGLAPMTLGQTGGTESVTLLASQIPPHSHALRASSRPATHATPATTRALAATQNAGSYVEAPVDTALDPSSVGAAGGGQPFGIRNPFLSMRWCISLEGIFPSRP